MANNEKQRPLIKRLRDLLDALKGALEETLEPRRPAPAPVPVRGDERLRRS